MKAAWLVFLGGGVFGAAMMIFFNSHDPVISEDVPEQSVKVSDRMGGSQGSEGRG
ncbi:hypothetical protein N9224_01505 [Akkermansiaceae bacterium]|nr:hypothetical protein [Akkermansiaceae bacterium]